MEKKQVNTNSTIQEIPADIQVGDVYFTKIVNAEKNSYSIENSGKIRLNAGGYTDFFCDPRGYSSNKSAPLLLAKIDNAKPFTFSAKVTPEFTKEGIYDAGAVMLYSNEAFWQKLCFEQDERGFHRIVTVKTLETSDDNNHDRIDRTSVYLKFSSDTEVLGCYYSVNGEDWQLVKIYKNEYPKDLWIGISSQSPKTAGHTSEFEKLILNGEHVENFRLGK